jgi:hypothetical protein
MLNRILIALLVLLPVNSWAAFPTVSYDSDVAAIVSEVSQTTINTYLSGLTGGSQITVGGSNYTLTSRATNSGTQINRATQWVYEHCQTYGWTASYENWSDGGYSSRNVICTKTGTTYASSEVVLAAHIDSFWPGADDDGSGAALLMHLAELLGDKDFKRTVKIVFFTGEEEGLYGSAAFVYNIAAEPYAMIVFDTTAYDSNADSKFTIGTGCPGYHTANANDTAIGNMFIDALSDYSISGIASINSSFSSSYQTDIFSLWAAEGTNGAVQINEDLSYPTPYYHSANDTIANLSLSQLTNVTKAAVVVTTNIAEYEPSEEPPAHTGEIAAAGGGKVASGGMTLVQ